MLGDHSPLLPDDVEVLTAYLNPGGPDPTPVMGVRGSPRPGVWGLGPQRKRR